MERIVEKVEGAIPKLEAKESGVAPANEGSAAAASNQGTSNKRSREEAEPPSSSSSKKSKFVEQRVSRPYTEEENAVLDAAIQAAAQAHGQVWDNARRVAQQLERGEIAVMDKMSSRYRSHFLRQAESGSEQPSAAGDRPQPSPPRAAAPSLEGSEESAESSGSGSGSSEGSSSQIQEEIGCEWRLEIVNEEEVASEDGDEEDEDEEEVEEEEDEVVGVWVDDASAEEDSDSDPSERFVTDEED
jgi:hypothetical protein